MTQTFRIFRKDVRHLAPFLLALLALHAVFAVGTIRSVGHTATDDRLEAVVNITEGILFLAWIFILALAIQQDPPVGENSFWLTRPYSWLSILAAKVLFAAVFLNLTLLVSDILILHTIGLPIDLWHLLLRQLPLLVLVIVPAFALSCISRTIAQFSLFLVLAILVMIAESIAVSRPFHSSIYSFIKPPDMVVLSLLPLCALPAIVIQFGKRVSWTRVYLPVLVGTLLPLTMLATHLMQDEAFFTQERPVIHGNPDWSHVHLILDPPEPKPQDESLNYLNFLGVKIPVRVEGLPPGLVLRGEGETHIGKISRPFPSSLSQQQDGSYTILVEQFSAQIPHGMKMAIRTSMDLWVLNDKPTVTTHLSESDASNIPNVGICTQGLGANTITCWQGPGRNPPLKISIKGHEKAFDKEPNSFGLDGNSYHTLELIWDFSPIEKRPRDMDNDAPIAPNNFISFAPRIPVGSFHANLADNAYPLADCVPEFEYRLRNDPIH